MSGIAGSARIEFASSGVQRVMAITLQIAALILLLLAVPELLAQSNYLSTWWTVAGLAAVALPAACVLLGVARLSQEWLRRFCGIQSALMIVVLALEPVAFRHGTASASAGAPWLASLMVIAGAGAAVAWPLVAATVTNAALQAVTFFVVFVGVGSSIRPLALRDALIGLFYVTLFAALAATLGKAGRVLDRTMQSAIDEVTAVAAAEATRSARRRVAELVHDSVIVALLAHADPTVDRASARREAVRALEAMDRLDHPSPRPDSSPLELAWELQALTTVSDPLAAFDYEASGDGPVPSGVSAVVVEAASEALRNSVRHALGGRPVARQVKVDVGPDLVRVLVLDDGDGFDPAVVPETRLGIRSGIIARMASVDGGSARVTGVVGRGTVVEILWKRP